MGIIEGGHEASNVSAIPHWAVKAARECLAVARQDLFCDLEGIARLDGSSCPEIAQIIYASVEGPIREAVEAMEEVKAQAVLDRIDLGDEWGCTPTRLNGLRMLSAALANLRGLSDAQKEKP